MFKNRDIFIIIFAILILIAMTLLDKKEPKAAWIDTLSAKVSTDQPLTWQEYNELISLYNAEAQKGNLKILNADLSKKDDTNIKKIANQLNNVYK